MPFPQNAYYTPGVEILCCTHVRLGRWWENLDFAAPHWRFYWHEQAGVSVSFAGKKNPLPPGVFGLISPNTSFAGHCERSVTQWFIHFLAKAPYGNVRAGVFTWSCQGETLRLIKRLQDLSEQGEAAVRERSMIALALVHLGLCHVPPDAIKPPPMDSRVVRTLAEIERTPMQAPDNSALARLAGMNTNAFIRLFRLAVGETPQAYSVRKRVDQATVSLLFSNRKIEEIAAAAGFCDRYHFTRVFQRIRGMGPAAYRRRMAMARSGGKALA
ncbi:MAG: AraC family transcriptional regulator [Verrucomicrobiae bacterium]|nr:AraC family transcriptional regulator [Verrucomicrobiae bacterium]